MSGGRGPTPELAMRPDPLGKAGVAEERLKAMQRAQRIADAMRSYLLLVDGREVLAVVAELEALESRLTANSPASRYFDEQQSYRDSWK